MALMTGGNIVNVERVKMVTKETTARTFVFETASSATFTAVSEEGTENALRIKNTIHGMIKTETLVKGYDIQLDDQKLLMEVYALIDGGTYTEGSGATGEKYVAPVAGAAVSRVAFDLYLYTSDRDTDGSTVAYHEWKFPDCKGQPVDGSFKDMEFATNSYKIASRPASGVPAMSVERITALPAVT